MRLSQARAGGSDERPHLEPDGDVVFVSSIGGTGGTVDAGYAASKADLHGLTRALTREYGDSGVQIRGRARPRRDRHERRDAVPVETRGRMATAAITVDTACLRCSDATRNG